MLINLGQAYVYAPLRYISIGRDRFAGPSLANEDLKFQGWKLPARATVTVGGTVKGNRTKMRYEIELSKSKEDVKLTFSNVTLLEMNGENRESPGFVDFARDLEKAIGGSMPDLQISQSSLYAGRQSENATSTAVGSARGKFSASRRDAAT